MALRPQRIVRDALEVRPPARVAGRAAAADAAAAATERRREKRGDREGCGIKRGSRFYFAAGVNLSVYAYLQAAPAGSVTLSASAPWVHVTLPVEPSSSTLPMGKAAALVRRAERVDGGFAICGAGHADHVKVAALCREAEIFWRYKAWCRCRERRRPTTCVGPSPKVFHGVVA